MQPLETKDKSTFATWNRFSCLVLCLPCLKMRTCLKMPDTVYNLMSTKQPGLKMTLQNCVPLKWLYHYDNTSWSQEWWAPCLLTRPYLCELSFLFYCAFNSNCKSTTIDTIKAKITHIHNDHMMSHPSNCTKLLFHFKLYHISEANGEVNIGCTDHYVAWVFLLQPDIIPWEPNCTQLWRMKWH